MLECMALIWSLMVGYCVVSCTMSLQRIVKLMEAQHVRR